MKLWDVKQVADFLNVKPRTVRERYRNNPAFPRPYKLNEITMRWDADEVIAFVKSSRES